MIYVFSFKHKLPDDAIVIDVTSRSKSLGKQFSPFLVGPVKLYGDYTAQNMENAFQYSRVYTEYNGYDDRPTASYFEWAREGWNSKQPNKYPLGAWSRHLYHWWDGKKITDRIEAQNTIFVGPYAKAIVRTEAYRKLKKLYETTDRDIYLLDFEGYDHRLFEMNWRQVMHHPTWAVGQGFVLAMLLEGYL